MGAQQTITNGLDEIVENQTTKVNLFVKVPDNIEIPNGPDVVELRVRKRYRSGSLVPDPITSKFPIPVEELRCINDAMSALFPEQALDNIEELCYLFNTKIEFREKQDSGITKLVFKNGVTVVVAVQLDDVHDNSLEYQQGVRAIEIGLDRIILDNKLTRYKGNPTKTGKIGPKKKSMGPKSTKKIRKKPDDPQCKNKLERDSSTGWVLNSKRSECAKCNRKFTWKWRRH